MKLGCGLPVSGAWSSAASVAYVARRAEELGYDSVWTFQRLLSDVDGAMGQVYRSVLDPMVTLGYAAAVTSRIRLGVAVVNLPFVSPVLLAKQAATVDVLSGGRLDLGLGLGWSDDEYAASGVTKARVGRRADEYVTTVRTLWTDAVVEHHGEFYQVPRSRMDPKPVQPGGPPILLGGAAPAALRRVGRLADGWVSSSRTDLARIGDSVRQIKDAATAAGRDPQALRFICRGVVRLRGDAGADRAPLTGTIDQIRADLDQLAGHGITEVFADLNFDPLIGSPDADPDEAHELADTLLTGLAPRRH